VDAQALKPLYDTLHRYAGWLDRERTSSLVRADIQALGAAIDGAADPTPVLQSLDRNMARLPSGALRTMVRTAAANLRRALEKQP